MLRQPGRHGRSAFALGASASLESVMSLTEREYRRLAREARSAHWACVIVLRACRVACWYRAVPRSGSLRTATGGPTPAHAAGQDARRGSFPRDQTGGAAVAAQCRRRRHGAHPRQDDRRRRTGQGLWAGADRSCIDTGCRTTKHLVIYTVSFGFMANVWHCSDPRSIQ